MNLTVWQWSILSLGAFSTGLSKTGILGVGVLGAALFANALPARASTGVLLPLLLCADIYGVALFRRHASWAHLWKLFPWVALGLAAGYFALGRIGNAEVRRMIGGILLVLVAWNFRPKRQSPEADAELPQTWWFAALMGMLAGFTTMVANAVRPGDGALFAGRGAAKNGVCRDERLVFPPGQPLQSASQRESGVDHARLTAPGCRAVDPHAAGRAARPGDPAAHQPADVRVAGAGVDSGRCRAAVGLEAGRCDATGADTKSNGCLTSTDWWRAIYTMPRIFKTFGIWLRSHSLAAFVRWLPGINARSH